MAASSPPVPARISKIILLNLFSMFWFGKSNPSTGYGNKIIVYPSICGLTQRIRIKDIYLEDFLDFLAACFAALFLVGEAGVERAVRDLNFSTRPAVSIIFSLPV